jgi:translation initiation factor 1
MTTRNNRNFAPVYSTEHGKMCPACGKPSAKCICREKRTALKGDGIVRIARHTKGRKGKGVTLIMGVCLDHSGLLKLTKQLKQKCSSGGTVKDGIIEIQGDHREMLKEELKKQGYVVKLSGG